MDGGAGNNQFIFNNDVAQGETVTFSGTTDTFIVQTATDFSLMNAGGSLNGLNTLDLTAVTASVGPEATFVSAQLTGATVAVTTTAAGDSIQVDASNANAANTINLSAITFSTAGGADINGGSAADTITATANGLDTVDAGAGNDIINGNAAVNILNGDAGQDTITGGGGADTITGGAGADQLTSGGAAAVTFVYNSTAADFVGANADTITDFAQGAAGDVLQLSATAFTGLGVGQVSVFNTAGAVANLATNIIVDTAANIALVGAGGGGTGANTNNRLAYDTTNNQWIYDNDGNFSAGSVVFANSTLALTVGGLNAANISIVA